MRLLPLLFCFGACTTPRTEVVIGVATDFPTTMVDQVKINIFRDGVLAFDVPPWRIAGPQGGEYELPATFGVYSDDGTEPKITVEMHGLLNEADVVVRRSSFALRKERTLYMRMAMLQSCRNVWMSCEQNLDQSQTCMEGTCKSAEVDSRSFNDYFADEEKFNGCPGGPPLIDTKTGARIGDAQSGGPMLGCTTCIEGACYK